MMNQKINNLSLDEFETRVGVNCLISSISNATSYIHKAINEFSIFMIGNGLRLYYQGIQNKSSFKEIKIKHDVLKTINDFFKVYNIKYSENFATGDTSLIDLVTTNLKENNPFLVFVNTRYLQYDRSFAIETPRNHIITITGVQDNAYKISDCYVPTNPVSKFSGFVSCKGIENAWNEANNKIVLLDFNQIRNTSFEISDELLISKLKENILNYISNTDNFGIKNLYAFSEDISKWPDNFPSAEISAHIADLIYLLKHEGFIAARVIIHDFLKKLFFKKNMLNKQVLEELETVITTWMNLLLVFHKAKLKPDRLLFNNMSKILLDTVRKEEEIFDNLYKSLN